MSEAFRDLGSVVDAVVSASERITEPTLDEVRRIRLRIDDPSFRLAAGQNVGVVVPGPHPFGNAHHMRRYSVAGWHGGARNGELEIDLLVRRCFVIDEVSGESYPGIASNFLCDAPVGSRVTLTGPYRGPFRVPDDPTARLLMIGTGTGVAPFRSFVQEIYRQRGGWQGKVRLYYGARDGMDLLYANRAHDDLANYYDEATFEAFRAVVDRPLASEADSMEAALHGHAEDIWAWIREPDTHVFLAGLSRSAERFDKLMAGVAPSPRVWQETRQRLRDAGRWSELVYS